MNNISCPHPAPGLGLQIISIGNTLPAAGFLCLGAGPWPGWP